jgi:dipeptidyl aminopeptidase/acylaminoacyl peptidase
MINHQFSTTLWLAFLLAIVACRTQDNHSARVEPHYAQSEVALAAKAIAAEAPIPLSVSTDATRILLQGRTVSGFRLLVWDRSLRRSVASKIVGDRPRLTAWSPDNRWVAFFEDTGGAAYRLYFWDVVSGKTKQANAPPTRIVTQTVWAPTGDRATFVQEMLDDSRDLYWVSLQDSATPLPLVYGIAAKAGIAWSPDAKYVATVRASDSIAITVADLNGITRRIVPRLQNTHVADSSSTGQVRDVGWSLDGKRLLATIQNAKTRQFDVVELDAKSGIAQRVGTQLKADASSPFFLPHNRGFVYRVSTGSGKEVVACSRSARSCRTLGEANSQTVPWAVHRSGDSIYLSELAPRRAILVAPVNVGPTIPIYVTPTDTVPNRNGRVDIRASDGVVLPLYLRRAGKPIGGKRALFIQVMGGLGKESPPPWDSKTDFLNAAGIDVMKAYYRGKAGFGDALLNARGGDSARVEDVLSAWRFAIHDLGVDPQRTVIFGHSDGAVLAAEAAAREPRIGGVVLTAMLSADSVRSRSYRARCAVAFHGSDDPMSPERGKSEIQKVLGIGAVTEPCGHFEVLPREAHEIERAESWAKVYASVVRIIEH